MAFGHDRTEQYVGHLDTCYGLRVSFEHIVDQLPAPALRQERVADIPDHLVRLAIPKRLSPPVSTDSTSTGITGDPVDHPAVG